MLSNIPDNLCLSVVMPVFNEKKTVESVVARVLAQPLVAELVIVDDASQDETWPLLQQLGNRDQRIRIFREAKNRGKGAALRVGFEKVTAP